jgi:RNA polymerase sigma-70 factor (ECF subfamily)
MALWPRGASRGGTILLLAPSRSRLSYALQSSYHAAIYCRRRSRQLKQIEATGCAHSDTRTERGLQSDLAGSHNKVSSAAELETISAILNGDQHKFHDLISPYMRGTYAVALRMLKNQADAEDATQEAFLRAFCCLRRFRGDSRFSTWLYAILLNESRARLRRNAKVRLESLDITPWDMGLTLADPTDNPAQALDRNETCTLLHDAIGTLPQKYREVFHLREEKGFSIRETADLLAITSETVKVRLHRARALLRSRLAPHFPRARCLAS